jgi:hypothetical protein
MDGWLVKPDAPALSPNWSDQGRYDQSITSPDEDGTPQATWVVRNVSTSEHAG